MGHGYYYRLDGPKDIPNYPPSMIQHFVHLLEDDF